MRDPQAVHGLPQEENAILPTKSNVPVAPTPPPPRAPTPQPTIPPEPIKLVYKYIGVCPECRQEVKTLELDIPEAYVIMGYCTTCDKKIEQQRVVPIKDQLFEK